MPRWTERERTALIDDLRDQIELVWMTGELHLEKPTVQHEVSRGLAFLRREPCSRRRRRCSAWSTPRSSNITPASSFELPPFLQYRLLDRRRPRRQSLGDHRGHRLDLAAERARLAAALSRAASSSWPRRCPSPSARFPCRRASSAELERALRGSGEAEQIKARNPGEAYRQFLSIVLRKLDATIARVEGHGYRRPRRGLCQCRRADPGSARDRARAGGGEQPLARRQSGQAGAPRRRDFPLLDRQARSPREHHQDHRRAAGAVVGDGRPRRRQPARAWQPRMARHGCSASWRGRSPARG